MKKNIKYTYIGNSRSNLIALGCDLTYKTLLYLPKIKVMIAFNPTY